MRDQSASDAASGFDISACATSGARGSKPWLRARWRRLALAASIASLVLAACAQERPRPYDPTQGDANGQPFADAGPPSDDLRAADVAPLADGASPAADAPSVEEAPPIDLAAAGFLDVTTFGADPTGVTDSTAAIQRAVEQARDSDMAAFFPSGTYLVSDTIRCMRKTLYSAATDKWRTDDHVCFIVGSGRRRPVIKLAPGAASFQDPANPRPVFWLWSMPASEALEQHPECEGSTDPLCEQSNISFNMVFKGIDIDLGGNPGAVGIRHAGAQGATLEDVKVSATGAYAGIYNPPGQAGGSYNVEVEGGQYGVVLAKVNGTTQGKFTMISGATFRRQQKAVFRIDLPHPMVVVGFQILEAVGPINEGLPLYGLSLIDGLIEVGGGEAIAGTDRNLYLRNVYLKGADRLAGSQRIADPSRWTHVERYALCAGGAIDVIDGASGCGEDAKLVEGLALDPQARGQQLVRQHVWDDASFAHAEAVGVLDVKDAAAMNGAPAKGDGSSDDTAALEYAIAHADRIFLPKGRYVISRTLVLGKHTQLFGAGRTYTAIVSAGAWTGAADDPLVDTVDDAEATTSLSFLALSSSHPLRWRAGRRSIVRSVNPRRVRITGHGGGRWTSLFQVGSQLTIEGTREPLWMYGTNPERAADPQWEIVDAQNVQIFYLKSETHVSSGPDYSTSLRIRNSRNIGVYGVTGNLELTNQMAVLDIIDSDDVVVTHARPFKSGSDWHVLRETRAGVQTAVVPGTERLALYRRGAPAFQ